MRLLTSLTLGLLGLAASAVAEDPSTESAIELQPTSFRQFIKDNDVVMAEFYAVCGPSQTPNWIQCHPRGTPADFLISSPGGECLPESTVSSCHSGHPPCLGQPGSPLLSPANPSQQPALSNFCPQV